MLIEAFSAVGLVLYSSAAVSVTVAWIGLALLAVVWLSTGVLQVPRHNTLSHGWNDGAAQLLCMTNWIRTIAWTGRSALMLYALWHALSPLSKRNIS
jgi:hypothetical protein